jgi:diguanylate cyclase
MALPRPDPDQQDTPWKARYLAALDDLERRERRWGQVEDLLRRALGRLAAVAQGAYPELDPELERLRRAVRKGGDTAALTSAAQAVSEAAFRLHAGTASVPARADEVSPVLRFLALCELGPDLATSLSHTRTRVQGGASAAEAAAALAQLAGDLSRALRQAPPAAAASETPLVNEALVDLLDHLDLPEGEAALLQALRGRLATPMGPADVVRVIDEIATLAHRVRRTYEQERRALEGFLQTVTDRLAELDASLKRTDEGQATAREDGQALRAQVQEQVDSLRDSVAQSRDLESLKREVQQRLSAFEGHVAAFLHRDDARRQEVSAETRAMRERLQRLEAEGASLRERVRRARAQAVRDPLTGVFNRLAYEERMAQEYARWQRYRDPVSLVVLDIDRFKEVNDRFGHAAGDRALKGLAEQLAQHLRRSDLLARYGGEEFVILMPKTERSAAFTVAEKLRALVGGCRFQYREENVPLTVSCGVTEFGAGDTPDAVFARADQALYRAKQAGRNRCEVG